MQQLEYYEEATMGDIIQTGEYSQTKCIKVVCNRCKTEPKNKQGTGGYKDEYDALIAQKYANKKLTQMDPSERDQLYNDLIKLSGLNNKETAKSMVLECQLADVGQKVRDHYDLDQAHGGKHGSGNYISNKPNVMATNLHTLGAGVITTIIMNETQCLQYQFFTLPILMLWILLPLYYWQVKPAYIAGMFMSVFGIILTFSFPSLVDQRVWYMFTLPTQDFMFAFVIGVMVAHIYFSYKAYMYRRYVCPSCVRSIGSRKGIYEHVQKEHPEEALEWMGYSSIKPK